MSLISSKVCVMLFSITIIEGVSINKLHSFGNWVVGRQVCERIVVAHRGASGYIPEHTLGAYALAITMGADFVEPDLVMTKDGELVSIHDNELSKTTDVAQHPEFADRHRTQSIDGNEISGWFTEDFTLKELKTLRTVERIPELRPGNARMNGTFTIPTFQEIIDLVISMQHSQNRVIGVFPEIKHSTYFRNIGLPMERLVVRTLFRNGYWRSSDPVYIQSFEVTNLKMLSEITNLKLIQLYESDKSLQPYDQKILGTNLTYGDMATPEGLKVVASYAAAVGPDKTYIIPRDENNRLGSATEFVKTAHDVGLQVIPYTFRAENFFLPNGLRNGPSPAALGDLSSEVKAYFDAGVDGLAADQPDIAVEARGQCYTEETNLKTRDDFIKFFKTGRN